MSMEGKYDKKYDICIIGGGASGLVAAIKAKATMPEASVVVLEKMDEPGKKVAASGNGRCNLSNLESEDWEKTSAFFSSIGLMTRVDSQGRIYPYSEDGKDVVRILLRECRDKGISIITHREVSELHYDPSNEEGYPFSLIAVFNKPKAYRLNPEDGPMTVRARKVLLATGGKSKPKLGTTGDGYRLAKSLGHSINTLIPALTGIETHEDMGTMGLSGIRQKVVLTLSKASENEQYSTLFQEAGEIQFTDYGVSGICVFDMSRFIEGKEYSPYLIEIDFAPDFSKENLEMFLDERLLDNCNNNLEEVLCSVVKYPMARTISSFAKSSALDDSNLSDLKAEVIKGLKNYSLHPRGLRGWEMAQITKGGVPISEIDKNSQESLLVKGLFFSGEIIDVDYRCGGFNLQNAWTTGLKAGEHMALSLKSI